MGREGEEWEETSRFFVCLFFLSHSRPIICARSNTQTHIGTQLWCSWSSVSGILIIHVLLINQHISPYPWGRCCWQYRIPLLCLHLLLLGNSWNLSCCRCDLYDIFAEENYVFKICLLSFVFSHSSAWNILSISVEGRNMSLQWMTLVCSRPGSVCVLPSEIKLQRTYQHSGQRWRLLACLLTEFMSYVSEVCFC